MGSVETTIKLNPCGDCQMCCGGQLRGNAHGNTFGNGIPCIFLTSTECTVYETRPDTCKQYQCAWSQDILDIDMRPDKCGLMVSVERINGIQMLKSIEVWKHVPMESYQKLITCANRLNTQWIRVLYQNE